MIQTQLTTASTTASLHDIFCNIFISTNAIRYNNCNSQMARPIPHNRIQIKERREDVLVLLTKGMKGYEIAKQLGVDASTVSRDIQYLISQSTT